MKRIKQIKQSRHVISFLSFFILLFCVSILSLKSVVLAQSDHKVAICHATSSNTNPYVQIVVDQHATNGHFDNNGTPLAGHEDDILLQGKVDCPGPVSTPTPIIVIPTPTILQPTVNPCDGPCVTPIVTDPTPTETPCGQDCCEECGNINLPTPTQRVTPSPTPTQSVTPTAATPSSGVTPTAPPAIDPTATPTPGQGLTHTVGDKGTGEGDGRGGAPSNNASGQVLGLASTGTFADSAMKAMFLLGMASTAVAIRRMYAAEKNS